MTMKEKVKGRVSINLSRLRQFKSSTWWPMFFKSLVVSIGVLSLAMLGKESTHYDRAGVLRIMTDREGTIVESHGFEPPLSRAPSATDSIKLSGKTQAEEKEEKKRREQKASKCTCPCAKEVSTKKEPSAFLADGRLILNRAGESDLVRLPGVGPSRAAAIVALRKKLKRFRKVHDLLRIRGIGWKSLKKLKPKIVLDQPPEEP